MKKIFLFVFIFFITNCYNKLIANAQNENYGAILVGGLTYGESLDKQVLRLSTSLGVKVKGFSYSSPINEIKEFIQQNKNIPIFLFSAGCKISSQLSSLPYIDKNKFYIIEPYFSGGETTKSVRKSVNDGIPISNIFVGPNTGRGLGIVKGASDSKTTPKDCHYCAISSVGKMVLK